MDQEVKNRFLVRYKNEAYDLSEFVKKHPGGTNTLSGMLNSDIDLKFEMVTPHSDAAKYLIKEYRVTSTLDNVDSKTSNSNNNHVKKMADAAGQSDTKDYYELNDNNNNVNNNVKNKDNRSFSENHNVNEFGRNHFLNGDAAKKFNEIQIRTDDSMEYLVDWSKGMVCQIGQLGSNYSEWVNRPVDRPLRLFERNYLEILTKTPWWLVPVFWIPIILVILHLGLQDANNRVLSINYSITSIIGGIILWTLLEYSLHRWVFHLDAARGNPYVCTFHFLLHGLHHKVPFDQYRLVFPPIPATFLAIIFYQPIPFLVECPKLVLAGGLFGYLCYDMIHYYIHHGSPSGGHLYHMKRYHYQHHFVHHDKGFGISSQIWDEAFGTKIILRKLKYLLKW